MEQRRLSVASVCHDLFLCAISTPSDTGRFGGRASMRQGGHELMFCRSWWPSSVSSRTGGRTIAWMSMLGCPIVQLTWRPRSWLKILLRS